MKDFKNYTIGQISSIIEESNALKIYRRLLSLDSNFFIFDKNYKDLKLALVKFSKTNEVPLLPGAYERQIILHQLSTLLHNYLAAAKTLIEHTRILLGDWYKNSDFLLKYKSEVKIRFSQNELTGFIEDLRNYSLHYSLPSPTLRISVIRNPETNELTENKFFVLDKKNLLKWSNWSKGRSFLRNSNDEINIEKLIDDYYDIILRFHGWIHSELNEIHKEDLHWLEDINKEYESRLKEILPTNKSSFIPPGL